jgi:hypothetical protein
MKRDRPAYTLNNSQYLSHPASLPNAICYRQAIENPRRPTIRFESCLQNCGTIDITAIRREWLSWTEREAPATGVQQPSKY